MKLSRQSYEKEAEFPLSGTDVIQEGIVYHTEEDVWVPAHIYRPREPNSDKLPGILLIQGWDLDKHSMPEFKVRLASAGYVVLFPDNRFSGERKHSVSGQVEQCNLSPAASIFGMTFMGMNTWDNMRALDILSNRRDVDVDNKQLDVVGLCWGGMQAWTLAAIDERVKAVCPVCSVSTYEALSPRLHSMGLLGIRVLALISGIGQNMEIYAALSPASPQDRS